MELYKNPLIVSLINIPHLPSNSPSSISLFLSLLSTLFIMKFSTSIIIAATLTMTLASPTLGPILRGSKGGDSHRIHGNSGQCNTGNVQCCNKVTDSKDREAVGILNGLGLLLHEIVGDVGMECSPVTGIGAGGGSWYVSLIQDRKLSWANLAR
jgi:hypothetical protein